MHFSQRESSQGQHLPTSQMPHPPPAREFCQADLLWLCSALPCSPHKRQNAFEHSEVLFVCLYLVSADHGTSLSLALEELLISTAFYWLAQNKFCFLAVILSGIDGGSGIQTSAQPTPQCLPHISGFACYPR